MHTLAYRRGIPSKYLNRNLIFLLYTLTCILRNRGISHRMLFGKHCITVDNNTKSKLNASKNTDMSILFSIAISPTKSSGYIPSTSSINGN